MEVKHKYTTAKGDGPDNTLIQPSNWNDTHEFTISATDKLVGRESAGAGAAEEIACTSVGRTLIAAATLKAAFDAVKQAATNAYTGVVELATQAEAEAGTNNTKAMTPFTAKKAVDKFNPMPIGVIMPYAGSAAPSGWLLCYGQNVLRSTYADLFAVLGTTYGAGNGTSTFTLPDLRGRTVAGQDDMGGSAASRLTSAGSGISGVTLGASGGGETHQLTEAEMPAHKHIDGYGNDPSNGGTGNYNNATVASTGDMDVTGAGVTSAPYTSTEGSDEAHNNVQPTLVLNQIVYTGV